MSTIPDDEQLKEIVARLYRLEQAVFGFEDAKTEAEEYYEDFRERCRQRHEGESR